MTTLSRLSAAVENGGITYDPRTEKLKLLGEWKPFDQGTRTHRERPPTRSKKRGKKSKKA